MTVRIVTDSVADIPPEVAGELGIAVVPLLVRFGDKVYRDGIDLTADEFYRKLATSDILPVTSVPPPADFAETYDRLAEDADEILVVTVTSRLSGTYNVAVQSVGLMKRQCRVEVVDSRQATMAQGFLAIVAARAARGGASLDEVAQLVRRNIPRVEFRAAFDTLEYLRRGGRIGRAQALLGSVLGIKPIIKLKNGVVEPAAKARSKAKAIEYLSRFAGSFSHIEEMAVEDTCAPDEAEVLLGRIDPIFPRERIYRSGMTPVIGTHTGPGLLLVAVMGDKIDR